jgi:threonine dehydratase
VPENKVRAIRELGARINIVGNSYDEAFEEASRDAERSQRVLIEPFDDPDIIAGQGTIGLEIIEDLPDVSAVVVPLSGGGLISGIALAVKSAIPRIRVIGVSMQIGAAMYGSQRAGRPVRVQEGATVADSLAGGIGSDNQYTFRMVRSLVDDIVLVTEEHIESAMRYLHAQEGLVTEGAAAVGVAALQANKIRNLGGKIVLVISGGNVDTEAFARILSKHSTKESRGSTG